MKRGLVLLLTTVLLLSSNAILASPAVVTILGNPLQVNVGDDASFQIFNNSVPGTGQIYPPGSLGTADMGIFVRVAGTLFAPDFNNHSAGTATGGDSRLGAYTPWKPISISEVTGTGTSTDPFTVIVIADAGETGLRMRLTVTYVNGEEFFRKEALFFSASAQTFDIFLGGDLFLAGNDKGVPFTTAPNSGIVGGQSCGVAQPYTILFIPLTPADHFVADSFATVWHDIGAGILPDVVHVPTPCEEGGTDDGAALQWQNRSIGEEGGSVSIQAATSFGTIPLIATFRVDSITANQGNRGQNLTVNITGVGFEEGTTFDFGSGITVTSTTIVSSTQATLGLSIAPGATLGLRDVIATRPRSEQSFTLPSGFQVIGTGKLDLSPPGPINFGDQTVGFTSAPKTIELTNLGGAPVAITTIFTSQGPFAISGSTCGASLLPGVGCQFNLTFTPAAPGSAIGAVTITSSGAGSPQTIQLFGNGQYHYSILAPE